MKIFFKKLEYRFLVESTMIEKRSTFMQNRPVKSQC